MSENKKKRDQSAKKAWVTTKRDPVAQMSASKNRLLWLATIGLGILTIALSSYIVPYLMYGDIKNHPEASPLLDSIVIVGVVLVLLMAKMTNQGRRMWRFFLDAKIELGKVVWPTRRETINSTIIVLIAVAIASALIFFVGWIFVSFIQAILG